MNTSANPSKIKQLLWKLALFTSIVGLVAVLVRIWQKKQSPKIRKPVVKPAFPVHPSLDGLSEAEAEAKRLNGFSNTVTYEPTRSKKDILRSNTLTIFNISLVGVAFVQLLLGLHWDMLLSLGVALLNVFINVFQEILAIRRLQTLEPATRPSATVIREGKARSIDPSEIVMEDVLVVGPGDQIQVDGEILSDKPILVDESIILGKGNRLSKRQGDRLYAGSFCISGRAAYRAQKVGDERLVAGLLKTTKTNVEERTPLEKIVERVLRIMLFVVMIMISLILTHTLKLDAAVGLDTDLIVSRVSVVFRLAPAGLYFMIFLNYMGGIRQLARQGALVRRARSVETLAQASTLWVSLAASRASIGIQVEDIVSSDKKNQISESRLHQILGDFAQTISSNHQAVTSIAELFPGDRRSFREQAPFLSIYGWMAVAFNEDDLRAVYVLGEKQVLNQFVIAQADSRKKESGETTQSSSLKNRFSAFRRIWKRSDDLTEVSEDKKSTLDSEPFQVDIIEENSQIDPTIKANSTKGGKFRKFFSGIGQAFTRKQSDDKNQDEEKLRDELKQPEDEVVYLFAYYPELVPLHDREGQPQLPMGLIPLCYMHFAARVNLEAVNTIRNLRNSGVNLKGFTPGDARRVIRVLESANLNQESSAGINTISGQELVGLDQDALYQAANANIIFNHVTSEQTSEIVSSMREHGDTVAVFGGNPSDIQIMQKSSLSITSQGSSQAALSTADIILLKEAPKALLMVMAKGQSIVRSLLDILKLYLTQLAYLTTLILALWALDLGFPYLSQQGSFIAIVTLTLPALALSLWELPGALRRVSLSRQLVWFVAPAALSISLSGIVVYSYFLKQSSLIAYAQLALTHMLVISGLLLFVMVRPPKRSELQDRATMKNWRAVILAMGLLITYLLFASLPIAFKWFRLAHLRKPEDYLVIGLAVLAWAVLVQIISRPFSDYLEIREKTSDRK